MHGKICYKNYEEKYFFALSIKVLNKYYGIQLIKIIRSASIEVSF